MSENEPLEADDLAPLVYDELRTLAHAYLSRERRGVTLETTALVHEAYLRLRGTRRVPWRGRTHFLAVAAIQMRRLLVEQARARKTLRRGGQVKPRVFDEFRTPAVSGDPLDVLAVEEALNDLAQRRPRSSRVATLKLFADMSADEIAEIVGVTSRTVKSDWQLARAWIARRLSAPSPG